MPRAFKTRHFQRWMRKTPLSDAVLAECVREMVAGLVDVDLGGGVVKKRVRLPGRGKRGSTRTIVATNRNDRQFFVFGFAKNERDNISLDELAALQELGASLIALTPIELDIAVADGTLLEIDG